MPITRNEYYRIGEAVVAHMIESNPRIAKTTAGKTTLEDMRKALRGSEDEDEEAQTLTMSPEEGKAWGLPQGIVVNGMIDEDFGYPGIKNHYHTPEYERMYAKRNAFTA